MDHRFGSYRVAAAVFELACGASCGYSGVVTAVEAYELTTQGGSTDFARLIGVCESFGPYCLIGGLAVNCYVEPVYTLDADLVVIAASLPVLTAHLEAQGFKTEVHKHSVNALAPGSELRIQFTTDERYQAFLARSVDANVLGIRVKVACREDVAQGKLWAYGDPQRRLSKRKKDELDLIRLAEAYPELKSLYPSELQEQLDRG
jgi:hypothetical protein